MRGTPRRGCNGIRRLEWMSKETTAHACFAWRPYFVIWAITRSYMQGAVTEAPAEPA